MCIISRQQSTFKAVLVTLPDSFYVQFWLGASKNVVHLHYSQYHKHLTAFAPLCSLISEVGKSLHCRPSFTLAIVHWDYEIEI